MHIVLEEITAGTASMSVKNTKIAAFRPLAFVVGFGNVHDDWDSIFVVVFDEAVEGIDGVAFNESIAFLYKVNVIDFWDFMVFLRLRNWFHG